jgi:hypothetical protein
MGLRFHWRHSVGHQKTICAVLAFFSVFSIVQAKPEAVCMLKSPDGLNRIHVSLSKDGRPRYQVQRRSHILIGDSPMGLRCDGEDFSQNMTLQKIGPENTRHEKYRLLVGNTLHVETVLNTRQVTLKNDNGAVLTIELAASHEGVGFRYRFKASDAPRIVLEEMTGFAVSSSATGWLQPYHAAGPYTPAYEDFYLQVHPGEQPPASREKPRGWALPGLFHVPSAQRWMLIAESGTDGGYCACHLDVEPSSGGLYKIAFAYEDEITAAKSFDPDAKPAPVTTLSTPWRVIVMGDDAKDIFQSTLVTDLAAPSQIEDTSWTETGRASWSWWSHPDDKDTEPLYNSFTDLAAGFGWEYTLFDAGWWNVDLDAICQYAHDKDVKPLIWMHATDFYDAEKRRRKLDDMVSNGIRGIKVDFWCSDRQEAMAAIQATLRDAAERKLVVTLHGCTIPRGWHRTWPNLLTAEAVLGTECYFYEPRYPEKVAELNTILPFTRNVMAPMDTTPVALTMRKFPRKTTAAHELAASILFNSGIIHYADSVEVFRRLPEEVKKILMDTPAAWDETVCLVGNPGREVVNGTDQPNTVSLNLTRLGHPEGLEITEGNDPLMDFSIRPIKAASNWQYRIPPFGGFVLRFKQDK